MGKHYQKHLNVFRKFIIIYAVYEYQNLLGRSNKKWFIHMKLK